MEFVDARSLLTPARLDYVVKWRFFRHLISGGDYDSERVYHWHIQERTGGREPRSHKRTVDQYVSACHELLASIESRGFDPEYAVRIGRNGLIRGSGAHRISCCVALGIPIAIKREQAKGKGKWDFAWFSAHGMSGPDMADLARLWAELR